jgi:superfamily II DNA or RNA helicase
MTFKLRDYQQEAINELRRGIAAGYQTQLLMAPTGAGKTAISAVIKQGAYQKGKRAVFIVDSLELVNQAAATFEAQGLPCGVIQGNHEMTNYSHPIQVATIQTLRHRWQQMPEALKFDLVVIDEAHVLHKAHLELIEECREKKVPVIGLSATPFRDGLGKVFDRLVVTITTGDLIQQGYLSPYRVYAPFIPELKGVKTTSNGDWQEDALAEYMGDAKIVGDVIGNWLKLAEGRQTIVFATNVAHSKLLVHEFQRCGINAAHIDGYERDPIARKQIIDDFRAGKITVLCNVAVLTKGFDAPETSCVVLARPTKSLMLHIQMLGRGLRTAENKTDCLIIDHAGNCLRNGLPDSDLPQELDDGTIKNRNDRKQREPGEKTERACVSCGFVSCAHTCPSCGFKPERREDVEVRDGILYELQKEDVPSEKFSPEQKAALYAELLGYARAHGMKDGWAWYKCKEYTGSTPRNTKQIAARQPSEATMRVIKHLQIKQAKSRRAAA